MHPLLIAGVALAGLPIVVHLLLKQEPKRLPFPAVRFLKLTQKTTQRRLRLRHLLLLALRVLLLGLFCAALYQPTVPAVSAGVGIDLSAGKPVAAVFVIDTTPSMGYTVNRKTRLDDAVARARELLDRLPAGSRVAVATTADPAAAWELGPADARRRLDALKQPDGGGQPVTAVLRGVYPLFAALDADAGSVEKADPLPRLVAVFTDRTAASWQPDQAAELKAAADALPGGPPAHLVFDVGVETPSDVAVVTADATPPVAAVGSPVTVAVTVRAVGADVTAVVRCRFADVPAADQTREVRVPAGPPVPVGFTFNDLPAGVQQAEVTLATPDNLGPDGGGFDNVRSVTVRVGAARKVLVVTDAPARSRLWPLALRAKRDFAPDVVGPADVPELAGYEVVGVLAVRDPAAAAPGGGPNLWAKLRTYVDAGGKVVVLPGGPDEVDPAAYRAGASLGLMPADLTGVADVTADPALVFGAEIAFDPAALAHPLFAPVKEFVAAGTIDFVRNPRRATKFWRTESAPEAVVARFADNPDPTKRSPAVLEKAFPRGGKVVLVTTRLDDPPAGGMAPWNDYYELDSSWGLYFPNRLVEYLAGAAADAQFQFPTGRGLTLAVPPAATGPLTLEGPGVAGDDGRPVAVAGEVRLPPGKTLTAGNYRVRSAAGFDAGFSLNPPADEADLTRVPADAVEAACGPTALVPAGKGFDLAATLSTRGGAVELFPLLVVLLLVVFAAEGVLANRFYRR